MVLKSLTCVIFVLSKGLKKYHLGIGLSFQNRHQDAQNYFLPTVPTHTAKQISFINTYCSINIDFTETWVRKSIWFLSYHR